MVDLFIDSFVYPHCCIIGNVFRTTTTGDQELIHGCHSCRCVGWTYRCRKRWKCVAVVESVRRVALTCNCAWDCFPNLFFDGFNMIVLQDREPDRIGKKHISKWKDEENDYSIARINRFPSIVRAPASNFPCL